MTVSFSATTFGTFTAFLPAGGALTGSIKGDGDSSSMGEIELTVSPVSLALWAAPKSLRPPSRFVINVKFQDNEMKVN